MHGPGTAPSPQSLQIRVGDKRPVATCPDNSQPVDDPVQEPARQQSTLPYQHGSGREWFIRATGIGNALEVLEDYSGERYGIYTSELWLRLEPLLTESEQKAVANARLGVQALLNLSAALVILALSVTLMRWCMYFPRNHSTLRHWAYVVGAVLVAYLCYRAAVVSARRYVETVIRNVDVNRHLLLDALRIEPPRGTTQEKAVFERLNNLYTAGADPDLNYVQQPRAAVAVWSWRWRCWGIKLQARGEIIADRVATGWASVNTRNGVQPAC
jgi:hypothetical protein